MLGFVDRYPRLLAWAVLSAGIIGLLVYEARDVDLTTTNWIALIVASIAVSGLCIWIVSWEDEDEVDTTSNTASQEPVAEATPAIDDSSKTQPDPEQASTKTSSDE